MDRWLRAALDYIPSYLDYQVRLQHHPGCVIAVVQRNKVIAEHAIGFANLATGEPMTPRHRFRVASHSKSFTATGVMKLREQGKVHLDAKAGDYVKGLHAKSARARIGQLLSHTAGFVRDGLDSGYFLDRKPFFNQQELLADLARLPPAIEPGSRFKYSNHGFGLLGQVIENVTGESYNDWIRREVLDAVGLKETAPDMPIERGARLASGHGCEFPLGRRAIIPAKMSANALASATGFVSTAADLARFFNQLSPASRRSILSADSRREMTRRHWRNPDTTLEGYYGLGLTSGSMDGWTWFGHGGAMPGFITRTATLVEPDVTVSVLTNAIDGWSPFWIESVFSILRAFERNGAPEPRVRDWTGPLDDRVARSRPRADGQQGRPCPARGAISVCECRRVARDQARSRSDQQGRWFRKFWRTGSPRSQARQGRRSLACLGTKSPRRRTRQGTQVALSARRCKPDSEFWLMRLNSLGVVPAKAGTQYSRAQRFSFKLRRTGCAGFTEQVQHLLWCCGDGTSLWPAQP